MSEERPLRERLQARFVGAVIARVDDALQTRAAIEPATFWSVAADEQHFTGPVVLAMLVQTVVTLVDGAGTAPDHVDCRRAIRFEEASGGTLEVYFNAFGMQMRAAGTSFSLERGALVAALARLPHDAAGARVRVILAPLTSGPGR